MRATGRNGGQKKLDLKMSCHVPGFDAPAGSHLSDSPPMERSRRLVGSGEAWLTNPARCEVQRQGVRPIWFCQRGRPVSWSRAKLKLARPCDYCSVLGDWQRLAPYCWFLARAKHRGLMLVLAGRSHAACRVLPCFKCYDYGNDPAEKGSEAQVGTH